MNKLFFLFVFILSSFSNTFCTSSSGKGRERKSFNGEKVRDKDGNYIVPSFSERKIKSTIAERRKIHPVRPDLLNLSALKEALPGLENDDVAAAEQALLDVQAQAAAAQDFHLGQLGQVNRLPLMPPNQRSKYLEAKAKERERQRERLAFLRNNGNFPRPTVLFARPQ